LEAEVHSNPDKGIAKMWRVYLPIKHLLILRDQLQGASFQSGTPL